MGLSLYDLVVRFLRLASHLYFLEIRASGRSNVPSQGPVLLAANHPNSILDAFLLATQMPRRIHYLARSGLFRYPVLAQLFRQLGAVPIYRAHETASSAERNREAFDKVHSLFERGGCVGIFPEGRNSLKGQVTDLRTGAARLALSAEARQDFSLGLVIVPVGLNLENRELLMSSVLLRCGEPIRVADYAELHERDPDGAIDQLTADIQASLRRQTLHIEDRRLGDLVDALATIFGEDLSIRFETDGDAVEQPSRAFPKRWLWKLVDWYRRSSPAAGRALQGRVLGRQHISEVLSQTAVREPEAIEDLRNRVARYRDHLSQTELKRVQDHSLRVPVRERLLRSRMTLYTIIMAPLALFGLVHNIVPYLLTKWLAQLGRDEAVRAFAYFGLGVITFIASYALVGTWLWRYSDSGVGGVLLYLLALPPTGFAALHYRRNVLAYRDKILVRALIWNRRELVELLREERNALLARFGSLARRHALQSGANSP